MPDIKKEPKLLDEQFQRAIELFNHVEGQVNFADNKAQLIFAAAALVAAAFTIFDTQRQTGITPLPVWYQVTTRVLEIGFLLAVSASIFCSLWAALPGLRVKGQSITLWYFGHIHNKHEHDFVNEFLAQPIQEALKQVLAQVHSKSRIAARKFHLVRWGILFLVIALLIWMASQLLRIVMGR